MQMWLPCIFSVRLSLSLPPVTLRPQQQNVLVLLSLSGLKIPSIHPFSSSSAYYCGGSSLTRLENDYPNIFKMVVSLFLNSEKCWTCAVYECVLLSLLLFTSVVSFHGISLWPRIYYPIVLYCISWCVDSYPLFHCVDCIHDFYKLCLSSARWLICGHSAQCLSVHQLPKELP